MRDRDKKNERESVGQTQSARDFQTNGSASALQYRNYGRDTTAPIAQQPPQPHDPVHEPTYRIIESHCQALTLQPATRAHSMMVPRSLGRLRSPIKTSQRDNKFSQAMASPNPLYVASSPWVCSRRTSVSSGQAGRCVLVWADGLCGTGRWCHVTCPRSGRT